MSTENDLGYDASYLDNETLQLKYEKQLYEDLFNKWQEKTEWVQEEADAGKYAGWHRADIMYDMLHSPNTTIWLMVYQEWWTSERYYRCTNCRHEIGNHTWLDRKRFEFCPYCGKKIIYGDDKIE